MCIRRVDQDASSPMHRRGDQSDRSTAGHQRQQLLHQEDGGAGVEIECLFEMFTRQGIDQSLLRQTGIRNSDVDNALFGPHRCSDTVEVIEICDISLDCRHIFPDQRDRLIQLNQAGAQANRPDGSSTPGLLRLVRNGPY